MQQQYWEWQQQQGMPMMSIGTNVEVPPNGANPFIRDPNYNYSYQQPGDTTTYGVGVASSGESIYG